jgi:hypothetical protein
MVFALDGERVASITRLVAGYPKLFPSSGCRVARERRAVYDGARTRSAFEVACVAPFEFPAQTRQATSFQRSATPSRLELSWSRVITLSLRSQRKEKTMGFVPAHDPGRHVRTWPTTAVPCSAGLRTMWGA